MWRFSILMILAIIQQILRGFTENIKMLRNISMKQGSMKFLHPFKFIIKVATVYRYGEKYREMVFKK